MAPEKFTFYSRYAQFCVATFVSVFWPSYPSPAHTTAHVNISTTTMTKATETLLAVFATTAVYFALYTGVIPTGELIHKEILPYLPWWALVTFGAYALGTLGWGVYTFKDKEGSYKELLEQIDEAKVFYKKNGLDLD